MDDRNIAGQLAFLATEVDSLAKTLVRTQEELARETDRRSRADTKAEELRTELGAAKKRAQAAERELGKFTATIEASAHTERAQRQALEQRLEQALQTNERLRKEVQRKESERHTMEANLREVMANLRSAAQEVHGSKVIPPVIRDEEKTLVPSRPQDIGW
jgi:chromosome segregation ATPase